MKKLLRNLSVLCFVFAAFLATGCYEEEIPFLTVDHEVVLVGPSMDKGTVVVESNVDWTASSDVPWITIDNGFGNHKGTFEFFVEANTTPNERSGKIKLDGGVVSVTILVRQQSEGSILTLATDEISFTKDAGEYLMNIACNGDWKVASSADWCKVDPTSGKGNGSFNVTVEENNTGADRIAVISVLTEADGKTEVRKIIVHQSASNAALVVSPESQELTAGASNFTLDVITTGSWEASTDSEWLTLSQASGTGDADITVSATANDTGAPRVAVITFATGAENENRVIRQIVVKQAAVDFYLYVPVTDFPLSLDEQTIEIPYELEGSNVTVTATPSSKWMTVQSVGDGVAVVKVDENKTAIAREGVVSFITHGQEGDPIIRQVRVAQAPTINLLEVLADEYAVEWTGETFRIPIYSNTPVSVRSSETWCTATDEDQEIVIAVPKNETAMPRVAVVTVTTNSESGEILSRTIIVRQAAAYSELVVTPESKSIYALAQDFVANIVTNNSWTAASDSDWLTIDKAAGTGDYMLTVSAAANETGQVRIATITVQTGIENSQRESATITVTQRPEQFYFEIPTRFYAVDKNAGFYFIPYITSGNEKSLTPSSTAEWLGVDTDMSDGMIHFSVTENKSAEARTGVITVTCTPVFGDPISIDVTVTQSPTINILDVFVDVIDVMARGDEVALPYYANTPVSVSSSEEWCHASVTEDEDSFGPVGCCSYTDPQKIIKIEVDPNRTGEARIAYVTLSTVSESGEKITKVITIRQAALYAALSVTPKNVVIPAHNGHFNVVINTTGTWAASTTCTWLDSDYDSGEDDGAWAGFGDAEMFFEAGVNDTGAQREGDIIIATGPENNEREEQVVHVIQLERSTYIEIPISAYAVTKEAHTGRNSLIVGYYAAGDFKDMRVDCSEDWIDYSHSRSDEEHLVFDIEENTTAEPRTATVTVTLDLVAGEPISDTFTVTQAPTINILDVYVDAYEASPWGETIVFPFYGNTDVDVSISSAVPGQPSWCSVAPGTPNQDTDPQELGIIVGKNDSAEARTAYVTLTTVTDKGEKLTHIITIHQNPLNAALMVNPEAIVLPSMYENATFELNIITSGTWTVATDCTWLTTEDDMTGAGDATIYWKAGDNDTGVQREAIITIWTGPENETRIEKTVKVIQLAYDTYLDIPQESYLIAKEGFSGLDNEYFKVACLAAGSIKSVVVDLGGADWMTWMDQPDEPIFGYLNFIVAPNDTAEPRTTTVTVTIEKVTGEPYTDSFTVTQAGTKNFLEGLSDRVSVLPVEDTITLPVLTNVNNLRAVVSENWLKADVNTDVNTESTEDFDYALVKIMAAANNTGKDRQASVTLITETTKGQILEKKIMVFQPATGTYFTILSGEKVLVTKAGNDSEHPLSVVAYASVNADKVEMIPTAPWIKVNQVPAVSADDETIVEASFLIDVNTTGERRTGEIVVTFFDEDGATVQKTVVIDQAAVDGGALTALVDYLIVSSAGEEFDLTFDADEELSATPTAIWLDGTAMDDEATDPQKLHIKAAANDTGFDRTAYIIVSNGSESVTITVFQPAANTQFAILSPDVVYIDNAARDLDLEAYASVNADQVVATSDQSWFAFTDGDDEDTKYTATFHAEANTGLEPRSVHVKFNFKDDKGDIFVETVTVIQAAGENVLEALVDYVAIDPAGDTISIAVIAKDDVSSVVSSSQWLKANLDAQTKNIGLKAEANTTGYDREAYVTVRNTNLSVMITVFQPAATSDFRVLDPNLVVDNEAQDVEVAAYGSTGVTAENIQAEPSHTWMTVSEPDIEGSPIAVFTVSLEANETGATRVGEIKVTWEDEKGVSHSDIITITQSPTDNVLDAYVDSITVPWLAAEELLPIYDNASNLIVRASGDWLMASIAENAGDPETKDVKIVINENNTGSRREGLVTLSASFPDGSKAEKIITVTQLAKPEGAESERYLFLETEEVTIPAIATTKEIQLFTNAADYTVSTEATWLTVSKGSVKIVAEANEGTEARTATVTIEALFPGPETMTKTLTVTQEAPYQFALVSNTGTILGDDEYDFEVAYTATEDPATNISVTYSGDATWVTATDLTTNPLQFHAEKNPNESVRQCMIYIYYTDPNGVQTQKNFAI